MLYIKPFNSFFINEMAEIIKKGQKLSVDGKPLKSLTLPEIEGNIIYYRWDKPSFLFGEGDTYVWFLKDDKLASDFISGENLLFFPHAVGFGKNAPIDDIWKKNNPIQKAIIGCIRAYTDQNLVYIDMMSVRPGYMKNGINKFMIKFLLEKYPNATLKFSKPTTEGELFINKYYPNAKIEGKLSSEDLEDLVDRIKNNKSLLLYTDKDLKSAFPKLGFKIPDNLLRYNAKFDDLVKSLKDYLK